MTLEHDATPTIRLGDLAPNFKAETTQGGRCLLGSMRNRQPLISTPGKRTLGPCSAPIRQTLHPFAPLS